MNTGTRMRSMSTAARRRNQTDEMQPIQALLNRIRWDGEFGRGEFVIGYYDRLEQDIIKVPLKALHFSEDDHFGFQFIDSDGELHSVPLHRVKEVYKDGELIWHREH